MNLGRSEYYKLKEKEKDLEILLNKFGYAVKNFKTFDWEKNPFITIALEFNDAKLLFSITDKYKEK